MDPIGAIESKGHVHWTLDIAMTFIGSNGTGWWITDYRNSNAILGILLKCRFIAPVGSSKLYQLTNSSII